MPTAAEAKPDLAVQDVSHEITVAFLTHAVIDRLTRDPVAYFTNPEDAHDFIRRKTETPDMSVDRALGIIRGDYNDDVHDAAVSIQDELLGRLKEQECGEDLREWLTEHIDETIDGCARVIYTRSAQLGVIFSDHDGAYFEEFGSEGAVEDDSINWSKLCYAAMRADVIDELERMDVDVNDPVPPCAHCETGDQDERYLAGQDLLCETCRDKYAAIERVKALTIEQCREVVGAFSLDAKDDATVETLRDVITDAIAEDVLDPAEVPA